MCDWVYAGEEGGLVTEYCGGRRVTQALGRGLGKKLWIFKREHDTITKRVVIQSARQFFCFITGISKGCYWADGRTIK